VRDDEGAVLAFVILLMLALLVLAHGALVAALSEVAGSRAAARDLELRAAARWALETTLTAPPGSWSDSTRMWDTRTLDLGDVGGVQVSSALTRLGPESWLISGRSSAPGGTRTQTARLAWVLDPLTRVTSLQGLVTIAPGAPLSLAGSADATRPYAVENPIPGDACDPWLEALATRYAGDPLSLVAELPDSLTAPSLGLLDLPFLLSAAPVTLSGTGTPAPAESLGSCIVDAPWGWGDPDRPWGPCGDYLPMRAAAGDLVVSGGVGQGLLVVGGDLTIRDGARFHGMVFAGGSLQVEGGAALTGLAIAGGGVLLDAASTLTGSACWAVRALAAQGEALRSLIQVSAVGPMGPW